MKKPLLFIALILVLLISTGSCSPKDDNRRVITNTEEANQIINEAIDNFFLSESAEYNSYYKITVTSQYYKALMETNASVRAKRSEDKIIYSQNMDAKYYEDLYKSGDYTITSDNSYFDGSWLYNNYGGTCLKYDGSLYNPVKTIYISKPGEGDFGFEEYTSESDENGNIKINARLSLEAVKFLYNSADPGLEDYGFSLSSVWDDLSVIDYSVWICVNNENILTEYGVSITLLSQDEDGNNNTISAQMSVTPLKINGTEPDIPSDIAFYADDGLRGVFYNLITNEMGVFIYEFDEAYKEFADTYGSAEAIAQSRYFSNIYGEEIKYVCEISHILLGDYGAVTGEYPKLFGDACNTYGEEKVNKVLEALGYKDTDLMMMGIVLRDLYTPDGKDLVSNFNEVYEMLCAEYGSERVGNALDMVIK